MTYPIFKFRDAKRNSVSVDVRLIETIIGVTTDNIATTNNDVVGCSIIYIDKLRPFDTIKLSVSEFSRLEEIWNREVAYRLNLPWPTGNSKKARETRKSTMAKIEEMRQPT